MLTHAQSSTEKNIEIVDTLTLLHSRTSAILAALSVGLDSELDQLPTSTVQEVLETAQAMLKNAQKEVKAFEVRAAAPV